MATLLFIQGIEYEFLGPMYISAVAKNAGHDCRLGLGRTLEDLRPAIEQIRPDLVGFSIMSGSHLWALDVARQIKRDYGIPNIFGGAHPTFFPEFIKADGVDMILRGEGEASVVEVLNRLDYRRSLEDVPNLWFKNGKISANPVGPLQADLDVFPHPDRDLYASLDGRLDRRVRNVITSRGCPWHCSFCFEDAMRELYRGKGKYVRIRRIERVIDECIRLRDTSQAKTIYFADDVFGMSKRWLYDFLPEYRKAVGLPFICLVRADIVASDREYAFRLADGGCKSVFFVVESGVEEYRNRILVKALTDRQIEMAARNLHDAGIPFRTYNMTALPGETLDDAFRTVELNVRIKADYPWCSVFSPFPGTALARHAIEKGYLDRDFTPERLGSSFFRATKLQSPEARQLENLHKFFQTAVLWPRTFPLIKLLIRLKPNWLFNLWFSLIYLYLYCRSERRGYWPTIRFALKNYRHVFARE